MAHSSMGCQSPRDYFVEQLLTILVCGALGFVAIQLYLNDMLKHILAPQFHLPVLIGGISVLVLVVVRAIAVWREAGQLQPVDDMTCQENHVHSAACNHLPGLPGGASDPALVDDGHSHDMSWMFVRMLVLVIPVALFALGIPNSGFSHEKIAKALGKDAEFNINPKELEAMAKDPASKQVPFADGTMVRELPNGTKERLFETAPKSESAKGLKIREIVPLAGVTNYVLELEGGIRMSFNELNDAAFDADKRDSYTGKTAILEGRFSKLTDKQFTLYRLKMTCCGADAVPLKVRIVAPIAMTITPGEWVRVNGVIRFIKAPGQERYTPVLFLSDVKDVERNIEIHNEYEF